MAELLATGGWIMPGSLGAYLRDALPDNYAVVADPIVHGCPIDAVVLGPARVTIVMMGAAEAQEVQQPSGPLGASAPPGASAPREASGSQGASAPREASGSRKTRNDAKDAEALAVAAVSPPRPQVRAPDGAAGAAAADGGTAGGASWRRAFVPLASFRAFRDPNASRVFRVRSRPRAPEGPVAAMHAFLVDEFRGLEVEVRLLAVKACAENGRAAWETTGETTEGPRDLAEAIQAQDQRQEEGDGLPLRDEALRESLVIALRDRRLTASMRAGTPFEFRSGSWWGRHRAWTVAEAVRHMRRHPDDGIYHLRNGTLARWLDDEGAWHLAALAREVMCTACTDPRQNLEAFLLGTGLVERPRLEVRPACLKLGHAVAGQSVIGAFEVRSPKGLGGAIQFRLRARRRAREAGAAPGGSRRRTRSSLVAGSDTRGYLFGTLQAGQPWLHLDPKSFAGGPIDVTVQADTASLPVGAHEGTIWIRSSASEQPLAIPVGVQVHGAPSPFARYAGRPGLALLMAAVPGAAAGWLPALSQVRPGAMDHPLARPELFGLALPRWLGWLPGSRGGPLPAGFWIVAVAILWALCGLLRGLAQPAAWPAGYAARGWLIRTASWVAGLAVITLAATFYWLDAWQRAGRALAYVLRTPALPWALCLAILPATVYEIGVCRQASKEATARDGRRRNVQRLAAFLIGVLVLAGLVVELPAASSAWQAFCRSQSLSGAQGKAGAAWERLDASANALRDQLLLRYYDRRAPEASPQPPPRAAAPSTARTGQ